MRNNSIRVFTNSALYPVNRRFNVLAIKLDHMGDFILSIPSLVKLKEKFKEANLDIIVGEWNVHLAEELGIFRDIYIYNFFERDSSKSPEIKESQELELLNRLKKYDIAVDLRRQPDTRFLIGKVSASLKAGYKSFTRYDEDLDICLDAEADKTGVINKHNKISAALQMMNLIDSIPGESIHLPRLRDLNPSERQVAVFPEAGNAIKEWPVDNYIDLVKKIVTSNTADKVNICLSNSSKKIKNEFKGIPGVGIFIDLEFSRLIDLLSENSLAIANNSFGAHISNYLGISLIAIYGGHETIYEWGPPFGNNTIIYSEVSCSPCHLPSVKDCPHNLICLKQITPDHVFNLVKKELDYHKLEKRASGRDTFFVLRDI